MRLSFYHTSILNPPNSFPSYSLKAEVLKDSEGRPSVILPPPFSLISPPNTPHLTHSPPGHPCNPALQPHPVCFCLGTSACTVPSAQNPFLYIFVCHSLLPSGLCSRVTTLFKVGVHTHACITHTYTRPCTTRSPLTLLQSSSWCLPQAVIFLGQPSYLRL
mgnify:CR=1 FL=1